MRCGARRPRGSLLLIEPAHLPRATARAQKRLHRANPVTGKRRSLRKISAELAAAGHPHEAQISSGGNAATVQPREHQGHGRGAYASLNLDVVKSVQQCASMLHKR